MIKKNNIAKKNIISRKKDKKKLQPSAEVQYVTENPSQAAGSPRQEPLLDDENQVGLSISTAIRHSPSNTREPQPHPRNPFAPPSENTSNDPMKSQRRNPLDSIPDHRTRNHDGSDHSRKRKQPPSQYSPKNSRRSRSPTEGFPGLSVTGAHIPPRYRRPNPTEDETPEPNPTPPTPYPRSSLSINLGIDTVLTGDPPHPHPPGSSGYSHGGLGLSGHTTPAPGPTGNFNNLDPKAKENFLEFLRLIKIKQHTKRDKNLSKLDKNNDEKITEQMFNDLFINTTEQNSFYQKEINKFSIHLTPDRQKSKPVGTDEQIHPKEKSKYTPEQRQKFREAAISLSGQLDITTDSNNNTVKLTRTNETLKTTKSPVTVRLEHAAPQPSLTPSASTSMPPAAASKKIIAISGNQTNIDVMLLAALRAQERVGKNSSYKIYVNPNGDKNHILSIIELYEKAKELGLNPVLEQHPRLTLKPRTPNIYTIYFNGYPASLSQHQDYQKQMQAYIQQLAGTACPLAPGAAQTMTPQSSSDSDNSSDSELDNDTSNAPSSTQLSNKKPTLTVKPPGGSITGAL